jgi:hypothetical protein
MISNAPAEQKPEPRAAPDYSTFLSSHRAQSVAAREFTKLTETVVALVKRSASERLLEAPTMRLSPDRCIVQLGPVALTIAYLRTAANTPGGQLLIICWRGTIAPRGDHVPERLGARKELPPPVALWEETHIVSAANEASWHWHPRGLEHEGYTSPELAERCAARLHELFTESVEADGNPAGAPIT